MIFQEERRTRTWHSIPAPLLNARPAHLPRRWSVLLPPAGGVPLRPLVGSGALGQGLFQAVGILEPILRALGQTAEIDTFEIGGPVGLILRQRLHFVASVGDPHFP